MFSQGSFSNKNAGWSLPLDGKTNHTIRSVVADRLTIEALTRKGRHAGRTVQRGRVLLRLADGGSGYTVADELGCCAQAVY